MARLSLPDKAIAAFDQRQERWGSDFGKLITHSEITNFLAVLDEPDFEGYEARDMMEGKILTEAFWAMARDSDEET